MKYFGLLYVAIGIFLGLMTFRNSNKISLHMKSKEIVVIEDEKYFKLQKVFGMVSSVIVFVSGIIFYIGYDRVGVSLVLVPVISTLIFNINNFILFQIALNQKMIKKAKL